MIPGIRNTAAGLILGAGRVLNLAAGNVAAAGTNQATATALPYVVNHVTAGDGTKGVRLPVPKKAGQVCLVYHSVTTVGLPVYPGTSGTINGDTANAALTIEGLTAALFVATSATNWAAIATANV